jgi:hypothetical protein
MGHTDERRDRNTLQGRLFGRLWPSVFLVTTSLQTLPSHARGDDDPVTVDIVGSGMTFPTVDGATVTSTDNPGGSGWVFLVLCVTVLVVFTIYAIAGGDDSEESDHFADESVN